MSENYQKCFDELTKLSLEKKELDQKHQRAGWALRREVEALPLPEFWELVEKFRESLMHSQSGRWGWKLEGPIWRISGEGNMKPITLYRFLKRWEKCGNAIRTAFDKMELEHRGDDAWGDLIDSSPLLGETIYNQVLNGAYKTEKELKAALHTYCIMVQNGKDLDKVRKNAEHMVRSVLGGENYFISTIDERALEAFTIYAE